MPRSMTKDELLNELNDIILYKLTELSNDIKAHSQEPDKMVQDIDVALDEILEFQRGKDTIEFIFRQYEEVQNG